MTATASGTTTAPEAARDRARDRLLAARTAGGHWCGDIAANASFDACDLLLREVLAVRSPARDAATARAIRAAQQPDGTWTVFLGGPGDLGTSVLAYTALRLAGDPIDAAHMSAAAGHIRAAGGPAGAPVATRLWLAAVGLWPTADLPPSPPELARLPRWLPPAMHDWAGPAAVAVTVLRALGSPHAATCDLAELEPGAPPCPADSPRGARAWLLRAGDRHARPRPRAAALRLLAQWTLGNLERAGAWRESPAALGHALLSLRTFGFRADHPVVARTLAEQDRYGTSGPGPDGTVRRIQPGRSPVRDTAWAVWALRAAGAPAAHPAVRDAVAWLRDQELPPQRWAGGGQVGGPPHPERGAGGGAWGAAAGGRPGIEDTAVVALALHAVADGAGPAAAPAAAAAAATAARLAAAQGRDGSWASFGVDPAPPPPWLPCGGLDVADRPSPDVTAHVLEALCRAGWRDTAHAARAVGWLLARQEADGSWAARWGVCHLYGTAAVLAALVAAGVDRQHPALRRAVRWLAARQNDDGGWGEDPRAQHDGGWAGRGPSTASQTAWAVLGLLEAGERSGPAAGGIGWLVRRQRADGAWDEPQYTATDGDVPLRRDLYRLLFPLAALGRYAAAAAG